MHITIPGEASEIKRAVQQLLRKASEEGCSEDTLFALEVCSRELLANAVEHGCVYDARREIVIELSKEGEALLLTVEDSGSGFEHDKLETDFSCSFPDCCRGRGLVLVRSLAHSLNFNEQGNKVTVVINCEK